jgi:hypothetical protein
MQEVNQVRGTLATRFYTLLLQPRRRIYLIQDSFCLTGIELLYSSLRWVRLQTNLKTQLFALRCLVAGSIGLKSKKHVVDLEH